ncbi:DNA (cytosine-5-)-methyltransferase [Enterovibrio norvegicus FF-454]|uniref:DNA (cytosine-5-)-methyltransferase n=1 Tax=Enterovibrio norvegicus FF-454 TaxID=1185651 RepID=A0A1E5CCY8_9GAMM|nr:DNA cytosine methyltransferase [Enterovibrio norvegicus]OEE63371.1 DNA (cytosine-5-)-methyltransferase [Enterovibrio norvegicus FF-454]
MLKNRELTYLTLFSSAGVGCYGFKQEGFKCIATNELLPKRINIQKSNKICDYDSGYINGDISEVSTKDKIYTEIKRWKKKGNDRVDVVFATPPCQGISVINHKKNSKDIKRNSLVVESIEVVKQVKPRVFIFENVMAFQKTFCITPDDRTVRIGEYIRETLGDDYVITGRVLNLMNYGSNSSRTRSVVIGVDKSYRNTLTPYDLLPEYREEKSLRDVISHFSELDWGEIHKDDFYHAFRTYDERMRSWISTLKEGESAFDNTDPYKRPHRIIDGVLVENVKKNRDKYTRQRWDRFIHCIHTRSDQLAAQNTIHPTQDRVYSIRELMVMMTIPKDFNWIGHDLKSLNNLSIDGKRKLYKSNELTIRQCIGEAVPTQFTREIAKKIAKSITKKQPKSSEINKIIANHSLDKKEKLQLFIKDNPLNLKDSVLMRITELCNAKREENAAFYTNKFIVNEIMCNLPEINKDDINILEPSVGAGNFIPFLIKRYAHKKNVVLDLVDIDQDSIETLKLILEKINTPENFKINIVCDDFLTMNIRKNYDLIVGNPPFSKAKGEIREHYLKSSLNKETNNLSSMFLEKAIKHADCVSLVLNKTILSNFEFKKTREILSSKSIQSIIDFGRYGFTGVSIETINIVVLPKKKPSNTTIFNMRNNYKIEQAQDYITDPMFPSYIIYRDDSFDRVAEKLSFGIFDVFRDRQITKSITENSPIKDGVWVIKAKNINDSGSIFSIDGYDQFIKLDQVKKLSVYKFFNDDSVYLTPNMTYNPRVTKNIPNTVTDGSTAILIPKYNFKLSNSQIKYFSSDEYRTFYKIARNLSTQSINVDRSSVFFYGKLKNDA